MKRKKPIAIAKPESRDERRVPIEGSPERKWDFLHGCFVDVDAKNKANWDLRYTS